MRHPIIAIIGRPNVGKSALFNRLVGRRIAIVDEMEGVTRDRHFTEATFFNQKFTLIDTGGLDRNSPDPLRDKIKEQGEVAIDEADLVIFVLDGQVGITVADEEIAKKLRGEKKKVLLAINKIDKPHDEHLIHSFHQLGFSNLFPISALFGHGVDTLIEKALSLSPKEKSLIEKVEESDSKEETMVEEITPSDSYKGKTKVAILGRCNVGKSTLVNALLGEERVITSPVPGVTRDAIDIPFTIRGKEYLLIDTAGIRRKKAEKEAVEKFAAIRTQNAIERSDIVLLLLDAKEGFTTEERRIAASVDEAGKGLVLLMNKWDLIEGFRMEHCSRALKETYPPFAHIPLHFISAAKKRNLKEIFPEVERVVAASRQKISTSALNKWLREAVDKNAPPQLKGRRLRLYYMTQVASSPPSFLLFANRTSLMSPTYKKYLTHSLRDQFELLGVPILLNVRGKEIEEKESE